MSSNLSQLFSDLAVKELVRVDLPKQGSNQHEINGKEELRNFFKTTERLEGQIVWHYFADDVTPEKEEAGFTFYESRGGRRHITGRSDEWRLYYKGNFLERADIGDLLVLARTVSGEIHALVFSRGSAPYRAALVLFSIREATSKFEFFTSEALAHQQIALLERQIIEELELEAPFPIASNDEDVVIQRFGEQFPKTKLMSAFAREQVQADVSDPDTALVAWLDREEQLFRALERVIVGKRLAMGFDDVDDFMEYSKSAHQRRKSRMGFALENHLHEIFTRGGLRFSAQCRTEGRSKPDFIFPGEPEYKNPTFNDDLLMMLGAKSSAKDRWRQVLAEADRISHKHVCTIEPGISEKQTREMTGRKVTLVIPTSLHSTYTPGQRASMLDLKHFIEIVRCKQP